MNKRAFFSCVMVSEFKSTKEQNVLFHEILYLATTGFQCFLFQCQPFMGIIYEGITRNVDIKTKV